MSNRRMAMTSQRGQIFKAPPNGCRAGLNAMSSTDARTRRVDEAQRIHRTLYRAYKPSLNAIKLTSARTRRVGEAQRTHRTERHARRMRFASSALHR